MNARGSTEVIVASIGLSMGLLNQNLYTVIVAMAVITTLAMPPMLRWSLARLPLGAEEKARLEREEVDAKGFLPQVERLLLAVDDSPAGRFVSRLTGVVAGARGIPTTVLHLESSAGADADRPAQPDPGAASQRLQKDVEASAVKAADHTEQTEVIRPDKVPVKTTHAPQGDADRAVAREAGKGYDLLLIGLDDMIGPDGGFHDNVSRIAAGFAGPLAVVVTRGDHHDRPSTSGFKILLPVSGGPASTRAAEFAIAIARANQAKLTALYVKQGAAASTPPARPSRRSSAAALRAIDLDLGAVEEEAFLKDLTALAERHGSDMASIIRSDLQPDEAILREIRRGGYNLVVMGVNRRPGDRLFFGVVPAKVLQNSDVSLMFIAG
jgi:nucleotide-binding universal stress UspA family protein